MRLFRMQVNEAGATRWDQVWYSNYRAVCSSKTSPSAPIDCWDSREQVIVNCETLILIASTEGIKKQDFGVQIAILFIQQGRIVQIATRKRTVKSTHLGERLESDLAIIYQDSSHQRNKQQRMPLCNALLFIFMEILVRWQGDTLFF